MNKKVWIVIAVLAVIIVGYAVLTYNGLITKSEAVDNQWAQVETQYQRRFDLIPNLVNSVKGVMRQEQEIFLAIAEARSRYSGAASADDKAAAASEVEGALGRLLVIMENYPVLQSATAVQSFMAQLEGTENRIAVERQRFNDQVKEFNVVVKTFPTNLVAPLLGFGERNYFEVAGEASVAPTVNL